MQHPGKGFGNVAVAAVAAILLMCSVCSAQTTTAVPGTQSGTQVGGTQAYTSNAQTQAPINGSSIANGTSSQTSAPTSNPTTPPPSTQPPSTTPVLPPEVQCDPDSDCDGRGYCSTTGSCVCDENYFNDRCTDYRAPAITKVDTISNEGGTIAPAVSNGIKVSLVFPPGALTSNKTITVKVYNAASDPATSASSSETLEMQGPVAAFSPSLQFSKPVTLELSYTGSFGSDLKLHFYDETTGVWSRQGVTPQGQGSGSEPTLKAKTTHFSRWVVMKVTETTSPAATPASTSKKMPPGVIVGIVFGCLGFLVLVGVGVTHWRRSVAQHRNIARLARMVYKSSKDALEPSNPTVVLPPPQNWNEPPVPAIPPPPPPLREAKVYHVAQTPSQAQREQEDGQSQGKEPGLDVAVV